MDAWEEPHRLVIAAELTAFDGERELGPLDPRQNIYNGRAEPITTPAVRSRPERDLYVNLLAFAEDGSTATLSVIVEPLVWWIWVGGMIAAIGGVMASLPKRRRRAVVRTATPSLVEV